MKWEDIDPETLAFVRDNHADGPVPPDMPIPEELVRDRREWAAFLASRREAASPATVPAPKPAVPFRRRKQELFAAVAAGVSARPALSAAVAANAVVLGLLLAVIYWSLVSVDKPTQDLQKLNQQIAEWDAAHAAEAEAFELSSKLSRKLGDLAVHARTMPPEEWQRKSRELVAEYQAFLAKHPDNRDATLDAFVENPELFLVPPSSTSIAKTGPLGPSLAPLEDKFMDFRRDARRMTLQERKRQAEELVAEYRAFQEKNPASHSDYIDLALTDPRFIAATKGGVIQASDLNPVPDKR